MPFKTDRRSLYEQDFALWLDETAAQLKARNIEHLDWENLIEEIEALGISQKHEVESRLKTILSHILKRCHVPLQNCYCGWQVTIRTQRNDLSRLLKKAPSLTNHLLTVFDEIYAEALSEFQEEYPEIQLPLTWPFSRKIEAILGDSFWQAGI